MLMFREEKSPEDEIKAWQFWHGRQHSVKQRILDAGTYPLATDTCAQTPFGTIVCKQTRVLIRRKIKIYEYNDVVFV